MTGTHKFDTFRNGVNVIGYFQGQFGLGETARLIVSSLEKQSIPFSLISADFLAPHHTKMEEYSHSFEKEGKYAINLFCIGNDDIAFFIQRMGMGFIKNRYNIRLFFWETDVVPKDRLQMLRHFDEIWVTTRYNKDCLASKIDVPVCHVPHPLQLNYKSKASSKSNFGLTDRFMFLFCFDFFGVFQRKNPTALIEAFRQAFPQQEDVQLVIKSHNGHNFPLLLNPILNDIKKDSRISWIDESMSQERRYDLINTCDCYVSLHRSEGFGLTMAEAMLLGKPVIATGYSGNLEYMSRENSFLCGYNLVPIGSNVPPYPPEGIWAEIEMEEAVFWMEYVFKNRHEAISKAARGKEDVLKNHSLDAVGDCIEKRLQGISGIHEKKKKQSNHRKLYAAALLGIAQYYKKGILERSKRMMRKFIAGVNGAFS